MDRFQGRHRHIIAFFIMIGVVMLIKAAHIQLFDSYYKQKASNLTIEKKVIYPGRGLILDRNKKLLVFNEPIYEILMQYNLVNKKMDTSKFCKLLNITKDEFIQYSTKDWKDVRYSKFIPYVFLRKVSPAIYSRFQESIHEFPGFSIQAGITRGYESSIAANILGYIKEVDNNQLLSQANQYKVGDYIGAIGLEKQYETYLKGVNGTEFRLKDNLGRFVGPYKEGSVDSTAIAGKDLELSIDAELQQLGEELMANKIGSIVAIEPSSGEILAMVSAPSFDPNIMTIGKEDKQSIRALFTDPSKPLFNRAVSAKYPPGSIFKALVALIGLQEKIITPDRGYPCRGAYYIGGQARKCHRHPGIGDLPTAIAWSCNSYFFQTYREIIDHYGRPQLGLDVFNKYLHTLGLGVGLGVDLPTETRGFVPTSSYYNKKKGERWKSPWIMSNGIGQGELQLTTLQMANIGAMIANNGWFIRPHLVKGFANDPQLPLPFSTDKISMGIEPHHFLPIKEGMEQVVSRGTARSAFIADIAVCGKTGTAQNTHGKDHSVFLGFAPKNNPTIAVAVYVENAGWGADFAAPIASLIMEKWIRKSISPARQFWEKKMKEKRLINRVPASDSTR
ncbi:MAG: penicillin-binding protein 2 [Saprospiraceae bacterium]|nr:penicillin-binding protein 2 [Saprospiraceae bacterium]